MNTLALPSSIASIDSTTWWPCSRGGIEAEHLLHAVQIGRLGLLVDADGAVALHIGMATDRPDAGAGLAEVAAQHQQVGDLLQQARAVLVLGQPMP
jgi:hypothetical protein